MPTVQLCSHRIVIPTNNCFTNFNYPSRSEVPIHTRNGMNSPDPALSCDHVVCARRCRRWSRGSARCAPPAPCHPGLFPFKNLQNCHFLNVVSVPAEVLARYIGDAMQPQWSDRQTTISHQSGTQLLLALFRLRVSSSHNSWSSRLFRIVILPDGQPASPLLPGYSFPQGGLVLRRGP